MCDFQKYSDLEIPETLMNIVVDEETPQNAPLSAKYKRSFAYPSMKDRCPVILTKIVDQLYRDKRMLIESYGEASQEEIKEAIGEISQLKNVLQTGKPFSSFTSTEPDTDIWNSHIRQLTDKGVELNYYEADWLFAECYLYRTVREIFATKKYLNNLDPFAPSKKQLLNDSIPAIVPLLKHLEEKRLCEAEHSVCEDEKKKELIQLFKCALWGNRLDLSLSGGTSTVSGSILDIIHTWDANIIVNDLHKVLPILLDSSNPNKTIEYIMDNSGMEALSDLCLCDYLVTHCGVKVVKLRVKPMPWYVSDVTLRDFDHMIDTFRNHADPLLRKCGDRWRSHVQLGLWVVKSDVFWCLGVSFSEMPHQDPALFEELSTASLLVVKGDLNYRKLLQDVNWEPTTPFSMALGKFRPAPLVSLRTNKAHLICGLQEGQAQALSERHDNWMTSGDFAVIQFDSP